MILEQKIKAKIKEDGPISFSEFMKFALYDETEGFYAHGGAGRKKDFITSPEVGPLFGKLISRAIDKCWIEFGQPSHFTFLECGAGPGTLAKSILRSQMKCKSALKYIAVESSAQQSQSHPSEVQTLSKMPKEIEIGIIFANELLDNLPFDIFESQNDGSWMEVKITVADQKISETLIPNNESAPPFSLETPKVRVPVQREAQKWLKDASESLHNGRIIVIDYAVESFRFQQKQHWLRTYQQHEIDTQPLANIGQSDITADVDVSQLSEVLPLTSIQTQAEWLRDLGLENQVEMSKQIWKRHAHNPDLIALEARSAIGESEALSDLSGLGSFKVLEWLVKS
tara:strand:+ start:519 stop:1541 length:1023 start_codon:yes stop_codon:yes gene_type:complete